MVSDELVVGEVVADVGCSEWDDEVTVVLWTLVGGRAAAGTGRTASGQLYSKDGGDEVTVAAGQLVKVQVYERRDGWFELDEIEEQVVSVLGAARVQQGRNSSLSWSFSPCDSSSQLLRCTFNACCAEASEACIAFSCPCG